MSRSQNFPLELFSGDRDKKWLMWLFATSQRIGVWGNLGNAEWNMWKTCTPNSHSLWNLAIHFLDEVCQPSVFSCNVSFWVVWVENCFFFFWLEKLGEFSKSWMKPDGFLDAWFLFIKNRSRFGSGCYDWFLGGAIGLILFSPLGRLRGNVPLKIGAWIAFELPRFGLSHLRTSRRR